MIVVKPRAHHVRGGQHDRGFSQSGRPCAVPSELLENTSIQSALRSRSSLSIAPAMAPFADDDFIDVSYGPTKSERKGQEQKFEEEWFDKGTRHHASHSNSPEQTIHGLASGKYSDPVVFGSVQF
jgi:hypothetical protein